MDAIAMKTPLYQAHVDAGARMTEFGGWLMPVQYSGIIQEHRSVRQALGIFDICHMGQVKVSGTHALDFVQRIATNDASRLAVGQAQYALLCNERGGVVDDIFIYRLPDCYFIVVNAANNEKDYAWMLEHRIAGAELENVSSRTGMISLQGPLAAKALQPSADVDLSVLSRNRCQNGKIAGIDCLIARTGYTGEDGFELFCARDQTMRLWQGLLALNPAPALCGLGARDTLRLEAKMPLYGHELNEETDPLEAGLGWAVALSKADFIGKSALLEVKRAGPRRKLVCLEMIDGGVPRAGFAILQDGQQVGSVTSGTHSPTLGKAIAIGYVPAEIALVGAELSIVIRDQARRARIVSSPFYKR